jgi:hypothetical protein
VHFAIALINANIPIRAANGGAFRLRRAQRDLDLRPDRYTHYYKNEFPERFHPLMDTRRWGSGERLVFEPYTKEAEAAM